MDEDDNADGGLIVAERLVNRDESLVNAPAVRLIVAQRQVNGIVWRLIAPMVLVNVAFATG